MELHRTGISVRCVCPPAVSTPMLDDIFAQGIPDGLAKLSRPVSPAKVLDAVEVSLRRRRRAIYIFPDVTSKVAWRIRRFAPVLLASALQRLVSTDRCPPRGCSAARRRLTKHTIITMLTRCNRYRCGGVCTPRKALYHKRLWLISYRSVGVWWKLVRRREVPMLLIGASQIGRNCERRTCPT
jgi:hypothetical protein